MSSIQPSTLHVLYVIDSLGGGGAEHSLAELLPAMAARDVRCTVVALRSTSSGVADVVRGSASDVIVGIGERSRWPVLRLRRMINALRPQVIHTTLFDADITTRLAATGTGAPVITSLVNMSYDRSRYRDPLIATWRLEASRILDGWTARHLTRSFHALTTPVAEASVEALGIDRESITVIGRGRDPERYRRRTDRAMVRESLGASSEDVVLLNVGRHEFQKGQEVLLRAMDAIRIEVPHAKLWLAGRSGNMSAEIDALIDALDLHEQVNVLGYRDDVPDLLSAADMFVFPSRFEGFGGAVVEAMAAGLPIVATDLPPLREVAGDTAVLITRDDPNELASTVIELVGNPQRRAHLGIAARRRFAAFYTIDVVADAMVNLYRSVAG